MKLFLCEKPSQAGDIAEVLGNKVRRDGYYDTAGGQVTWCIGHMLEQMPPDGYRPEWSKPWRLDVLPFRPDVWKVLPKDFARKQLTVIAERLKQATSLVIATDADREGEMIARELLDFYSFRGPIQRLWLSALDTESVKRALLARVQN